MISQRILFSKIYKIGKGFFPKIKGSIFNIPIQVESTYNVLPRVDDDCQILLLNLKRKLSFKSNVISENDELTPYIIIHVC